MPVLNVKKSETDLLQKYFSTYVANLTFNLKMLLTKKLVFKRSKIDKYILL